MARGAAKREAVIAPDARPPRSNDGPGADRGSVEWGLSIPWKAASPSITNAYVTNQVLSVDGGTHLR